MSRGAGAPSPPDAAALQPGPPLRAAGTAACPAACTAVPASGLWCGAFLLLAACVCATAVPDSLGALAAVTWGPPGSSASQRGVGDSRVTASGDLVTSGCFPGLQGAVTPGAGERSLGTRTAATRTPRTSLQGQPGSGDREGLRLGTAVAATLSPTQWPGRRTPAPSARLLQTDGVPSPGSWRHLARGGPHRAGPGSRGATQTPAVTPAGGLRQPAGTAEPQSARRGSEGTSRAWSEPAAGVPATPQVRLPPASLPTAASGPSAGAAVMQQAPNALVPLQGAAAGSQVPPDVPAWTLMDARSWSPSTAEQVVASALPTPSTPGWAQPHPGTGWVPPALTPEGLWSPAGTALPGKAAPSVDVVLAQVPGNGSALLDAVLASLPPTAAAPGAHSQHVLASSHPTAQSGAPAVISGMQGAWPSLPAQPMSTGASPAQSRAPSPAGPTVTGMSSAATGVIPEHGQMFVMEESGHSRARTASVGPVPTPAGPPGPTPASTGSVPPPCSTNPALELGSQPGHRTATTSSVTSPSCLPTSPGARHAASCLLSSQSLAVPTGVTLDAHIMSSGSSTSQRSSTAMEPLPAATRGAFSPAELMTRGKPGSRGTEPPASHPYPTPPVLVLPLQFRLLGITYTSALGSRDSESYRQLEGYVTLLLNQLLSSYKSFLQANVLEFMNGSVVVRGEVLFQGDAPAPTNSHLIRTILTGASKGRSLFSWQLEPQSVQSGGFSLENLEPEKLSISLTGSQLGMSRMDPLERLVSEVTSSVSALYHVRNFTISQLRNLHGNTEITGDLYLDTIVHADVTEVLEALATLSGLSMELTSVSVEGSKLGVHVYPLSFLVTNRHFSQNLQDPLSAEHHNLSRDLSDAVARALRDYPTFLKAIIKEFLPGSLICHGNMIFFQPAPSSVEVLKTLVLSVGPNQALADSDIHVDPYSLSVGEDTLEPPSPQPGFPAYGVALMVIGGLCIITAPIVLVCLGTKRLGWQDGRVLQDRRDPEVGVQTLEMDNQGFWTEDPEDGHFEWQSTSA